MAKQTDFTSTGPTQREIASLPPNGPDDISPSITESAGEIRIANDNSPPSVSTGKLAE